MTDSLHKTVSYGRKNIAFGLPWFTADEDEQPFKAAASLIKKSPTPFDLVLARTGEVQQFALACTSERAKSGSLAAAAMVAEMVGIDSWVYVLELDTDIWICAGRDGYILPDGDVVYEDIREAKAAFRELSPATFKKVFVPKSWREDKSVGLGESIEDVEGTDLRDFLMLDAPKWAKLKPASSSATLLKAFAAVALLGGVAFVAMTMLQEPADQQPEMDYEQYIQQLERERLASQRENEYSRLDSNQPWAVEPSALAEFSACLAGIHSVPITPVGYSVTSVMCNDANVEATLIRTSGYTSWLKEWAATYPDMTVSTDPTGTNGKISINLSSLESRGMGSLYDTHTFDAIQEDLFERGQIEGSGITVAEPIVDTYPDFEDYVPSFATGAFKIATKRPEVWADFFRKWDGISIDSVTLNLGEQTYTMEGKLYVPNH